MSETTHNLPRSLDELRQEIDRLDSAIHTALMERMAVVEELAGAKGDAASMRPAREMEVLRALVTAHEGALPIAHVIGLWREIMANSLMWQTPYSVAFFSGGQDLSFWDLARFHFGSATPLAPQGTIGHVLQEVSQTDGSIGILPEPMFEEAEAWWPHLLFTGDDGPRVIAKLPLFEGAAGYDFPGALALGKVIQRPTGEDASLMVVLADVNLRRAKVIDACSAAGIEAKLLAVAPDPSNAGQRFLLFETTDFVSEDDARLVILNEECDGILRARIIGGYAKPIQLGEGN